MTAGEERDGLQALAVNDSTIAFRERGSGPPVLFIHGSGTYSATFAAVIDELPSSTRAIVYDRRGFADSAGPGPGRLLDHVRDAAAMLDALAEAPATVVGSSAGGVIALRLAIQRPDLVKSLVLVEPAYQMALTPSLSATLALVRVHWRWLVQRDPQGAATDFYRWATRYRSGGSQFDTYPEEWRHRAVDHAGAALGELRQLLRPGPGRRALRSMSLPVWVVIGDAGQPVFHRTSQRVLKRLEQAIEVTASGAHLVYTDDPTTCAKAILAASGGPAMP